jgi:hypothetical protein
MSLQVRQRGSSLVRPFDCRCVPPDVQGAAPPAVLEAHEGPRCYHQTQEAVLRQGLLSRPVRVLSVTLSLLVCMGGEGGYHDKDCLSGPVQVRATLSSLVCVQVFVRGRARVCVCVFVCVWGGGGEVIAGGHNLCLVFHTATFVIETKERTNMSLVCVDQNKRIECDLYGFMFILLMSRVDWLRYLMSKCTSSKSLARASFGVERAPYSPSRFKPQL